MYNKIFEKRDRMECLDFDFQLWIKEHNSDDYRIVVESNELIKLITDYGETREVYSFSKLC